MVLLEKYVSFYSVKTNLSNSPRSIDLTAKKFKNFMLAGKINAALRHPESASN